MNLDFIGYKIIEELGFGGMATVYKATQLKLDRLVVIKTMKQALYQDEGFRERFVREAKISAKLSHPNIVQIYDVVVHENGSYLSIEYIDGGDLSDRLKQPIDMKSVFNLVNEISSALDYAHNKNVIHRDVKTKNILVRSNGSFVLADFGIAKAMDMDTQMTMDGTIVGSPKYMSPEQARGHTVDSRSDFYGFGIVLFEVLSGSVPFDGDSSVSVALKHLNEPVPRLEGELEAFNPFFKKMLAKKADERYANGAEVVEGFWNCLQNINEQTVIHNMSEKNSFSPSYLNTSYNSSFSSQQILSSVSKVIGPSRIKNRKLIGLSVLVVIILGLVVTIFNQTDNQPQIQQQLTSAYKLLQSNQLAKSLVQFKKVLELDNSNEMAHESIRLTKEIFVKDLKTELLSENYAFVENKVALLENRFNDDEEIQAILLELQKSRTLNDLRQSNLKKYAESESLFNSSYAKNNLLLPVEDNAAKHLADMIILQPKNLKIKSLIETLKKDILSVVRKEITTDNLNVASKLITLFETRYGPSEDLVEIKRLLTDKYQFLAGVESDNKRKLQVIKDIDIELVQLGRNLTTPQQINTYFNRYQDYIYSGGNANKYQSIVKTAISELTKNLINQPLENSNFKELDKLFTYEVVIKQLASSSELIKLSSLLKNRKHDLKKANSLLEQLSDVDIEKIDNIKGVINYYSQLSQLLSLSFEQTLVNQRKHDFIVQMEEVIQSNIVDGDIKFASQLINFFEKENVVADVTNWQIRLDQRKKQLSKQQTQIKLRKASRIERNVNQLILDGKGLLPFENSALSVLANANDNEDLNSQLVYTFVDEIYLDVFQKLKTLMARDQYEKHVSLYANVLAAFDILSPTGSIKHDIVSQTNAYKLRHENAVQIQAKKDKLFADISSHINQSAIERSLDTMDKIKSFKQANIPKEDIKNLERRIMLLIINRLDLRIENKEKKKAQRLINRALISFVNNEELLTKKREIENIKDKNIKLIGF